MMRFNHSQQGFTLVEMVMAIAINTLLIVTLMGGIAKFYEVNAYTIEQAQEVDHARRGMTKMIRDLREMTFADDGTWPVARMEEHIIGFYSDIDQDNSVEYVEYELATTTIVKTIYNATGSPPIYDLSVADETLTLSEFVRNSEQATSTFYYFDTSGVVSTSTTLLTDVRYIKVNLIVNVDPNRSPGEFMIRSSAAPRNLKDNL